ncbi:S-layer homology domain-containing protein [Paenibacillus sp. FSL H7-0331]|uniref:S-layer homology domain-containing protein n=1 Tax=Paenibacillus sp. FSL H7-0331 TaxID=1920421 RepID=UPI0015C3226C|nr:S-layer homology domain-containing protein [Paenibacillus sp. FSL H7-0331]
MKKSLLLLVTALLCLLPFWSRSAHADRNVDYGELAVSVLVDGVWIEQGSLPYGRFVSEKSLQLNGTQADEPALIRVLQQGGGKSHLDSVLLGIQSPIEVNGDTATSVRKLAAADQDLINVEVSGMILKFASGNPSSILKIDARVEPEVISTIPFHYPTSNLYKDFDLNSEYYTYPINSSRGNLVMDGQINEISLQAPFFQQYTVPDSGHPDGVTYGWVWNDDENLYVVIDFTPDNTFDGDADYTKVYVKTNSGVKEFKVSVPETTWGQQFFTYTDKVSYQHKVYEYQIPLTNLEIAADQTELQLGFAAYGTAAAGNATDNDQTHAGIDGRDISVEWVEHHYSNNLDRETYTFDIYILPSIMARIPDLASDKPINKSPIPYGIDDLNVWNWTGSSTDTRDSTGIPLTGGDYKVLVYINFSPAAGAWVDVSGHSITLQSDVDASKFAVVDNYTGTQDKLQSAVNAVGANLPVKAYLWTDSNSNGTIDPGELGPAISLGTSGANGSVAAANIGDLTAGTYKFVITATDNGIESIKDAAHAVTVTLTKGVLPLDVTLNSILSNNPTAGVAKVGDTVTVTFTSNRELSALPNVYIGDFGTAIPATSVSGNVYSAARTFTANDSEGDVFIYFSASAPGVTNKTVNTTMDSSGNSVNFDKTSPAGTLSINGGAAVTDTVSVTLTVTGKDPDGIGAVYTKAEKQPIWLASTNDLILRELAASMKLAVALPPSVPGTGNVQMSFSNDEVSWSQWEPVAGMKPWTLSAGNGTKMVYMKLKDAAGNETATVIIASIELQEATPLDVMLNSILSSNPMAGVAKVGDTVTVTFTSNRELSALPNVYIGGFGTAIPATSVSGNVYSAARTFTASDSEGDVLIYFSASAPGGASKTVNTTTDSSGNSVNFDKTSPAGTLSINSGVTTTNSVLVTLTVTGEDPDGIGAIYTKAEKQPIWLASTNDLILRELAASMKLAAALPPSVPGTGNVQMSFSNDEVTWSAWEPVAGTKPWTLSVGIGTKTVYMKLKDAAGNETATAITASIELRLQESSSSGGSDSYQQSEPITVNEPSTVNVEMEDVKPETEKQHKAYISGYPDGTFGPEKSITRAEMATLLFRAFEKAANKTHFTYTDVASTHWAQEAIEQVTKMGLMEGYEDGSFKAEQMITRAEIAVILSRLSSNTPSSGESFPDVKGHWAQTAIEQLKATGIISGYADGTFRPEQTLKRAEVVAMINRLLGRGPLTTMAAIWSDVPNDHWAFGQIQEASIDHAAE